jgi:peptidoglycan/xylan/chitin deacetylase (PgdA/CDA1 family)
MAVRAYGRWRHPRGPVVTVLGYHRIANNGDLAVSCATFDEQMSALDELRAELPTLPLDEALDRLADGTAPRRSVVVTFDDAWAETHEHALAALVEHGIPATLYVPTGFLGKPGFISRSQLSDLVDGGIGVGAHTRTHPDLRTCSDEQLDYELAGSRGDLEDLLGTRVDSFAYPAGLHDNRVVRAVARAGFRSAITTSRGWLRHGSDPLRIRRSFVEDFSRETFVAGARGGMNVLAGADAIRGKLRDLSRRGSEKPPV